MNKMKSVGWRLGALLAFVGAYLCAVWCGLSTMALLDNALTDRTPHMGMLVTTASALGLFMLWPLRSALHACEHRARMALASV